MKWYGAAKTRQLRVAGISFDPRGGGHIQISRDWGIGKDSPTCRFNSGSLGPKVGTAPVRAKLPTPDRLYEQWAEEKGHGGTESLWSENCRQLISINPRKGLGPVAQAKRKRQPPCGPKVQVGFPYVDNDPCQGRQFTNQTTQQSPVKVRSHREGNNSRVWATR